MSRLCVAFLIAAVAAACRRTPARPPVAAPTAPAHRAVAPPPFTHPLFAGRQVVEAAQADCSRRALTQLSERLRIVAHDLSQRRRQDSEPWLRETRDELLPRAAACVGHDGPLDVPWEMLHSAILSLEICADARQQADERVQRCRRALDIAQRADRGG